MDRLIEHDIEQASAQGEDNIMDAPMPDINLPGPVLEPQQSASKQPSAPPVVNLAEEFSGSAFMNQVQQPQNQLGPT